MKAEAPYYVYEGIIIEDACESLRYAFPGFDFLYSVKANPFGPVMGLIAEQGFGADAASALEVELSRACGIPAENIYYSTPGKREKDIRRVMGNCVFVADSLHELQIIQAAAAESDRLERIGLRLHPDFTMAGGEALPSKFGIGHEQLAALKQTLRACPNLLPVGIHVHLKSQVLSADTLGNYYRNVMNLTLRLREELGMETEFINFGSGIGTVYDEANDRPLDLERLRDFAGEIMSMNRTLGARLMIETGRYVLCRAGRYITPVVDKKMSHGTVYLIVSDGLNGFLRPAVAALLEKAAGGKELPGMEPLFTSRNAFQLRVLNESSETETVTVAGSLCTALDVIKENVTLQKAEIGDLIEISNAGSYAYTLSPLLFSGQDAPGQYLITKDGQWIGE